MNNQHIERYFTKDNRLELISNSTSIEEHIAMVDSLFTWSNGVGVDIKSNFEIVKSLLVYSWYNYYLIDEAVKKALFTYELAMKIRYKELTAKDWKKDWKSLINELYKMSLFDDSIESIQNYRVKRNFFAHTEGFKYGGITFWKVMGRVVDNINGMYDDIEKRKERLRLNDEFDSFVRYNFQDGFEVNYGAKPLLGHEIHCLWISNKNESPTYSILVYYCTNDDFLMLKDAKDLPKGLFVMDKVCFSENLITGTLINSDGFQQLITIDKKGKTIEKVQKWKTKFLLSDILGDYNAYKSVCTQNLYQKCKREYMYSE